MKLLEEQGLSLETIQKDFKNVGICHSFLDYVGGKPNITERFFFPIQRIRTYKRNSESHFYKHITRTIDLKK